MNYNMINDEDLIKVKQNELDILRVINAICNKYSIEYFLIGGTLLGAVNMVDLFRGMINLIIIINSQKCLHLETKDYLLRFLKRM